MTDAADPDIEVVVGDGEILGFSPLPDPTLVGSAARIGHYVWLSARLFEITGHWATDTTVPAEVVRFAAVSSRFAWQADEWRRRLPCLREVDAQALIRPPSERTIGVLDRLAATPPTDRLASLGEVVGQLDQVYDSHAAAISPIRDGAVRRSLHRVRADLADLSAHDYDNCHIWAERT